MSERWRQELEESKAEIARLRDRLATAMPMVHKDLSLISLVPKWSGALGRTLRRVSSQH